MKKTPLLLLLLMLLFACEKEPVPSVNKKTVKDHEGNEYAIKEYGSQTWMVENMKAKTTRDGKNIVKCPANGEFSYEEPRAYYLFDKEENSRSGRGYLYNFAAANEICPDGWHLPSAEEWRQLINFIDKEYTGVYNDDVITVAKAMASKSEWSDCDTVVGAPGYHSTTNNLSGFNQRPIGGYYTLYGTAENPDFHGYSWRSYLWTSTPSELYFDDSYEISFAWNVDSVEIRAATQHQALSVRCVKNQ